MELIARHTRCRSSPRANPIHRPERICVSLRLIAYRLTLTERSSLLMIHAFRRLLASPGFTLTALITLALGIGVNTTSFSVLNALLLHTPPYAQPETLVGLYHTTPNGRGGAHSPANFLDYRAQNTVFEHVQDETGRRITWLVAGLAGFVLLIACANLANLQFARNAARGCEHAIRAARGASEGNLLRLVLRDSLRLTLAGLASGVVLAFAASRGRVALLYAVPVVDLTVYIGAALLMTLACVAASLIPARRAAKINPISALRAE